MRRIRSFLPLLCLALLYWGCQKSDTANHASTPPAVKPTTTTINVPENVPAKVIKTDSLITNSKQLAELFVSSPGKTETDGTNNPPFITVTYDGYNKTYDCSSNNWTYVYIWTVKGLATDHNFSGSGTLTIGTFSMTTPFTIISAPISGGFLTWTLQYTIVVPNDDNYCNSTTLQEMISFTFTVGGTPQSGAGSNTENIVPNVYQTYNDIVPGFSSNGNGTFTLDVTPGVTICGTACNAAIRFPPTVTFYYSLEGSGTWQSYSQAGTDLSEFFLTLPQAGTYDYYTQEDTAPGVLSGELGSGSITVQ